MYGQNNKPINAVGYCRVSTLPFQDASLQVVQIKQITEARGFSLIDTYVDQGISGRRERRPALDRLMADARRGRFKILVVTALDRLGRDVRHLLNLIHELDGYGVTLISLRESLDFGTPMGRAALTIVGVLSQLEAEWIKERIRCALAAKKISSQQTGIPWRCGRPPVVTDAVASEIARLRAKGHSIRQIVNALNRKVSRTSICRVLRSQQVHQGASPKNLKISHAIPLSQILETTHGGLSYQDIVEAGPK